MHSSHVSACYDYSIHTQAAEAGSPQVRRSNTANEGARAKGGGGSHFCLTVTLGGNMFTKSRVALRQPFLHEAHHLSHGKHQRTKIS